MFAKTLVGFWFEWQLGEAVNPNPVYFASKGQREIDRFKLGKTRCDFVDTIANHVDEGWVGDVKEKVIIHLIIF